MYFVILAFIGLASFLVWYLLKHDHGRKLPVATLWYACGFGVLGMVLAMAGEHYFLPAHVLSSPGNESVVTQLASFLGVGVIEETVKFVPLALFIYKRNYFREHTDGSIYFAICGLTFGLGENILYTISYGTQVGMARLLLTPFLHAATTSILGYYLIHQKLQPSKRWLFVLACFVIPTMHGLYDFGLGTELTQFRVLSLMLTMLLTMGLFLYFMEANTLDRLALARTPIGYAVAPLPTISEQITANFCSSCGKPNPEHRAYCTYCGRKL